MNRSRRFRWSWWKILAALVLVSGAGILLMERPWEAKPRPVAVEVVAPGAFSQVLAVNGRVAARQSVAVRSPASGQAMEVLTAEGDTVNAGDVLVQLDPAQPKSVVDQAQAALEAGMVKQAQARATVDRAVALGENSARSAREDAELALAGATNEVARLRAALNQAKSLLDQYTVRAPLDGVVLSRGVDRGQQVDPQVELFRVADISELLVETDVDELYSSRIKAGLPVLLKPVGDTVSKPGEVVFAAPAVDPTTGGRAVKIAFEEPADLPVGLTVNANIIVSEQDSVLTVPRGAVVTEGADSHVLVIQDGLARVREIEISDWPADRVIVTTGLAAGDVVILDPAGVRDGQSVRAE